MTEQPRTAVLSAATALPLAMLMTACLSIESKPIEIKPIHITMDINLRVQRALDEFFDFDEPAKTDKPKAQEQGKE